MTAPPRILRKFLPTGFFSRAILILLIPVVVLQLVVGAVFFERHYQRVTAQMTQSVAEELGRILDLIADTGAAEAMRQLDTLSRLLSYDVELLPGADLAPGAERDRFDFAGAAVVATLERELDRPLRVDLVSVPRTIRIEMTTDAGLLRADVPRARVTVPNPHQLLVLMVIAGLILTTIAVLFLRNQVRPIRRLAEAAEAFGKGRSFPFRPTGADEVRRAGSAFLSMRARIERQMEQRTRMLSGVSHDLRTPLTRMKLTLEMMEEDEDVAALRSDVDEMDAMLSDFLAFARGAATDDPVETDAIALAKGVVEDARRGGNEIELAIRDESHEAAASPLVLVRPGAVARALHNLLGNAARHGRRARLTLRILPKTLDFTVEDDGPGIPESDRARALQPFSRLDAARNLDRGGSVGLGLTIALDIARVHGGALELGESADLGGLRATLRLPR